MDWSGGRALISHSPSTAPHAHTQRIVGDSSSLYPARLTHSSCHSQPTPTARQPHAMETVYLNGQQVDFMTTTTAFSSCASNAIGTSESSRYPHFKKSFTDLGDSECSLAPLAPPLSTNHMTGTGNGIATSSYTLQQQYNATSTTASSTTGNGTDSSSPYFHATSETNRESPQPGSLLPPQNSQLHGGIMDHNNYFQNRDAQLFRQQQQQHSNVYFNDPLGNGGANGNNQSLYPHSTSPNMNPMFLPPNCSPRFLTSPLQQNVEYSASTTSSNVIRGGMFPNGNGCNANSASNLGAIIQGTPPPLHFQPPNGQMSAPSSTRKSAAVFWQPGNGIPSGVGGQATPPFITSTPIKEVSNNCSSAAVSSLLLMPGMNAACNNSMRSLEYYYREAQDRGFIVGANLEKVLQRSSRCSSAINNKILSQFKTRYGEVDSKTRSTYLHLGVRVPSKEHVSEIVGKGGSKIKSLRDETGALITTPGEQEDHVFIIEAPPPVALQVATFIQQRSDEISLNKAADRRRGSGSGMGSLGANLVGSNHRRLLAKDKISVPQDLVGKIIGTQGSIITTIQKDTGTEIRSPPKDLTRDPRGNADFEIATYEQHNLNFETARQRIYKAKQLIAHLVMRQYEKMEEEEHNNSSNSMLDLSCGSDLNWPSTGNGMSLRNPSAHRGSLGSHEQTLQAGGATGTFQIMSYWKWPEIDPMNPDEAREVIDRILVESKNKTRKESSESPELTGPSGGSTSYTPPNGNLSVAQQSQSRGVGALSGLGMMAPTDYVGTSNNGAYFHSMANRTLPNLLNNSIGEDMLNNTIATTDGSDILRGLFNNGMGSNNNFSMFGQWNNNGVNNNSFNGGHPRNSAFDPPSSGVPQNSQFYQQQRSANAFNGSMPSSLEAFSAGTIRNSSEQSTVGGMGLYPPMSITYPTADGSIRGLDALSHQLSHSMHLGNDGNLAMQQHSRGDKSAQGAFGGFNVFNSNVHTGAALPVGSGLPNSLCNNNKRFQDTFTFSNDSGFESIGTGPAGAGCYQQAEMNLPPPNHHSLGGNTLDLGQPPVKFDFLDQHSLLFDKTNPWRTGSFSNIDALIETHNVPPTPEKVGIIGDGRKKTPSPTHAE